MQDCVFCNIIKRTIDSKILFEDEDLIVINDIFPKAPLHFLVIPKKHVESVNHLEDADVLLAGKLLLAAKRVAKENGIAERGYKLVINVGPDGGQVVHHLHLHVLGGKKFAE